MFPLRLVKLNFMFFIRLVLAGEKRGRVKAVGNSGGTGILFGMLMGNHFIVRIIFFVFKEMKNFAF